MKKTPHAKPVVAELTVESEPDYSWETHLEMRPDFADQFSDEHTAVCAYHKWTARGCPPSDGKADWYAAKSELAAKRDAAS